MTARDGVGRDGGERDGGEPTIYDLARVAGVSPSTVSRALSRPERVSFRTAEHVRAVAERMGYRARRVLPAPARSTGVLALIMADLGNPVFVGMIRGAEQEAARHGITMIMVETQESETAERRAVERLEPTVDGIILSSSRMADRDVRSLAGRRPVVTLNRVVSGVSSVGTDEEPAIREAAAQLADQGHDTVAYLAGPDASYADGSRWRSLRRAGRENGLRVRRLPGSQPTLRGGADAAARWLDRPTSAVLAYNDLMAIGFLQAVTATGLRVPADVSVVGFDNIPDAELVDPMLTTIAAPLVSLGTSAVSHLLSRSDSGAVERPEPVLLPARLIVRGSTGAGTATTP